MPYKLDGRTAMSFRVFALRASMDFDPSIKNEVSIIRDHQHNYRDFLQVQALSNNTGNT